MTTPTPSDKDWLDEIFERMDDYTIFHDRNDGDFKSPDNNYLASWDAKDLIRQKLAQVEREASWNGAVEATEAYLIELKKKRPAALEAEEEIE